LPSKPASVTPAEIAASNITTVGLELISILGSPNVTHSEDCLYLNVWSKPQTGESQKPVMIFIYGGAFDSGTSSNPLLRGSFLADNDDVVLVTFK
jgi:cholinesterase